MKTALLSLLLMPMLFVAGCVTAESSFEHAKQMDNVSAYRGFLAQYPQHPLATEARTRIDDIDFQAALKTNTVGGYEDYLKNHQDSRHLSEARQRLAAAKEDAFNKQVSTAIIRADYGQLVAMEENAKRLGYVSAAGTVRRELERFDVTVVGAGGYEIAASTADQKRLESAKAVVRVRCAIATSRSDSLGDLLSRNIMSTATSRPSGDSEVDRMNSFMDLAAGGLADHASASGGMLLYLYPEADEDEVTFREGALELRDRINGRKTIRRQDGRGFSMQSEFGGNAEGTTVATLKSLRRSKKEDRVFSILEGAGADGKATYCALILILQLPAKDQLAALRGQGGIWIIDTKGNSIVSVDVASPEMRVLVSGAARLPKDRWIAIGPGLSARGGEIRFEETRVVVGEGAQLARRRP